MPAIHNRWSISPTIGILAVMILAACDARPSVDALAPSPATVEGTRVAQI